MPEKSYFYVFLANVTELDKNLSGVFDDFQKIYAAEVQVYKYYPGSPEFRPGLRGFGIKKVPGFALADTEYKIEEGFQPNPFISVDRSFLEGKSRDELFNLVRDWHDINLTENILRLRRDKLIEQSKRLFGRVWEEVKEAIQVVTPIVGAL